MSKYDVDDGAGARNSGSTFSAGSGSAPRYIEADKKTASIGRRSQRLSVPLDELFDGDASGYDTQRSASNQPKPMVNVPRGKAHMLSENGSLVRDRKSVV